VTVIIIDMTTLWIYGDSYVENSHQEHCWGKLLQQQQGFERLETRGLAGVGNDWIFRQIRESCQEWQAEDRVVCVWSDVYRQWWFPDEPQNSNIASLWGRQDMQELEERDPDRVTAVGYYLSFLSREDLDLDRLRGYRARLQLECLRADCDLCEIPAFDTDLEWSVQGDLTEASIGEFHSDDHRTRYLQDGVDPRPCHFSQENHRILALKIQRYFETPGMIDFDSEFVKNCIPDIYRGS